MTRLQIIQGKMRHLQLFFIVLLYSSGLSAQGIAVIELFTSQGCSSCPAADKNLSEIIQKAEKDGKPVYGLSFHVDYWNYIGWKDPYSSKAYTDRQQKYAQEMSLSSIYTPQMIVNGQLEFVGSSKDGAERAIDEALSKQIPSCHITISNASVSTDQVRLHYSIDKAPTDEVLNLAVVERDVENFVPKGENKGKNLHHDNVVRAFETFPLKKEGELNLKIPPTNSSKTFVILYIQDKNWKVVAATALPLPIN